MDAARSRANIAAAAAALQAAAGPEETEDSKCENAVEVTVRIGATWTNGWTDGQQVHMDHWMNEQMVTRVVRVNSRDRAEEPSLVRRSLPVGPLISTGL